MDAMSYESNAKDNPITWSFPIGRLFGITIRIHVLFVFGVVFLLALAMKDAPAGAAVQTITISLLSIAILFGSVLLHEFGHCWGARKTGGSANEILMWPLGGLATVAPPHTPKANAITTIAGPMVNVLICAAAATALSLLYGASAIPWNPVRALYVDPGAGLLRMTLHIAFALNLILFLFNVLLPMYPLDGGRLLHAALWHHKGYRQATMTATFVGMVGAIVLGVVGIFAGTFLLIFIAIFGYVTCFYDRQRAKMLDDGIGEMGYDFSQGYTSLGEPLDPEKHRPGRIARWRVARARAREIKEAERREATQRQVDEILKKVHDQGLSSLTAAERRVLEKETERQRTTPG